MKRFVPLRRLVSFRRSIRNAGMCAVCRRPTIFVDKDSGRDGRRCLWCWSYGRERALLATLTAVQTDWRTARIHEFGPSGKASARVLAALPHYTASQYWPDTTPGDSRNGVRCENLEAVTFRDDSFDVVVTQDVLEHIYDPDRAFAEIARVLRPGGLHIFTVPLIKGPSIVRVTPQGGHLLPAEYHLDPLDPHGALVTRDWGDDIAEHIEAVCGMTTRAHPFETPQGTDSVLVSRKSVHPVEPA